MDQQMAGEELRLPFRRPGAFTERSGPAFARLGAGLSLDEGDLRIAAPDERPQPPEIPEPDPFVRRIAVIAEGVERSSRAGFEKISQPAEIAAANDAARSPPPPDCLRGSRRRSPS